MTLLVERSRYFLGPDTGELYARFEGVDRTLLPGSGQVEARQEYLNRGIDLALLLMGKIGWSWADNQLETTEVFQKLKQNFQFARELSQHSKIKHWEFLSHLIVVHSLGQSKAIASQLKAESEKLRVSMANNKFLKAIYLTGEEPTKMGNQVLIEISQPELVSSQSFTALAVLKGGILFLGLDEVVDIFACLAAADLMENPNFQESGLVISDQDFWRHRGWAIDFLYLQRDLAQIE